ncbi:MAG: VOC family protein [Chloroflexi bacterium]|nr:VOC family protein [Chloroflexota bacterium]
MSSSSKPVQGTPVWWDLASTDVDATKKFYSELLGWEWHDLMSSPQGVFTVAKVGGRTVGGVYTDIPGMPKAEGPPMWVNTYWVEDAEAAMNRAVEKGGTVLMPACEDPAGGGFKSLLLTPEGAPFVVWSGDKGVENEAYGEMGAVCWTEYYTRDVAGINDFVGHLFGSRYQRVDLSRPPVGDEDAEGEVQYQYFWLKVPDLELDRGGMMEMDASWGDMASHFMVYFRVEDCDASAAKVAELGGEVCVPPTEIPPGKFSVVNDSLGSTFSIMSLRPME